MREQAADAGRCALGLHLAAGAGAANDLVQGLAGLDPGDRLLGRDVARWQVRTRAPRRALTAPPAFSLGGGAGVRWFAAQASGTALVALGRYGGWLRLARLDLESGTTQHMTWDEKLPGGRLSFFLSESSHELTAFLQVASSDADQPGVVPVQRLPTADRFPLPLRAGTLGPITKPMHLATVAPAGWWILTRGAVDPALRFISTQSDHTSMRSFDPLDPQLVEAARWLFPVGVEPCLASGTHLVMPALGRPHHVLDLGDAITSVLPHPGRALPCVIVGLASGAAACWHARAGWRRTLFAERMRAPLLAFTRSGLLVASDRTEARAYRVTADAVTACGAWRLEPACNEPVAMTCGMSGNEIAFLQEDGGVRLERVRLDAG